MESVLAEKELRKAGGRKRACVCVEKEARVRCGALPWQAGWRERTHALAEKLTTLYPALRLILRSTGSAEGGRSMRSALQLMPWR